MDLEKNYDLTFLVNDTERMVLEELGRRLDEEIADGLCDCQECVLDIAALALNNLKPHYHASLLGTMYAHAAESGEFAEQVQGAVDVAIKKVKKNPSHG
ncbi:MAG: late competence development ComFB family protein [Spirochaetes bacterium]|nr:late competence development ComFB family protein [Spirochaetota bacterium]MBU0956134.1 late competence development ComFB family protein [Spirochaetota bacterium]